MVHAVAACSLAALALVACAHGVEERSVGELSTAGAGTGGTTDESKAGGAGLGGGVAAETGGTTPMSAGAGGTTAGAGGTSAGLGGAPAGGSGGSGGGGGAGGGGAGGGGGGAATAGAAGMAGSGGGAPVLGPDITASGTPVAFMMTPSGGGNRDLEVLRDNDLPPVDSADALRQYDTFTADPNRTQDWLGYTFATSRRFMQVLFQNGKVFSDGGWFDSVEVQVRSGGVWKKVADAGATPAYAGAGGKSFASYAFDFDPILGDGIRVFGTPGGSMRFISCGELRVREQK